MRLTPWEQFTRDITSWQARHGVLPGLSTDPADYVKDPTEVLRGWHENDRCGGACQFCRAELLRCTSTPPPFKYSTQQCDGQAGHKDEHWFHDGFTRYVWTYEHMVWCGLDKDHEGMCHPAHPDPGEKGQPEQEPEAPPEVPEEGTEPSERNPGAILLRGVIDLLTAVLEEIE